MTAKPRMLTRWRTFVNLIAATAFITLSFSPVQVSAFCPPQKGSKQVQRTVIRSRDDFSSHFRHFQSKGQNGETTKEKRNRRRNIPSRIVHIYTEYASRLWRETNPSARQKLANDKIASTIRQVQTIIKADDNHIMEDADVPEKARKDLHDACETVLEAIKTHQDKEAQYEKEMEEQKGLIVNGQTEVEQTSKGGIKMPSILGRKKKKKNRRSIGFGALMGAVVACWVFSGNYIFTGLFTLMTILGQLEYYRMIMNTGVYPARRISILGACSMFLAALLAPDLHQICLPMFGLWAMVWFLTVKRNVTTISEIATTFTGMFYLGYVPSFWVRIRMIGMHQEPTRIAHIVAPFLSFITNKAESSILIPQWLPQAVHLPITTGAVFIFWTWLCLAFSDVGAYFVGKNLGKTKLGSISPAAGATSPNKTVEGVIGGCAVSAFLATIGAWVQRWPYPFLTGPIHGIILGFLGLLGDLTASMLKRDAGLKDFGDLLPEHGGIMDRVDSFVWTAPYSWLVCAYIIPVLKQFANLPV